jgi:RNA polymerase sigma-70 factor (ECF subfamily)
VADRHAQEDVLQNALVSLHRARHTYRPEHPFGPWFRTIVRNAVLDWARARGRRARREVSLDADGVPEPAAEPAVETELSPELEQALAALPAAQREAVELIHVHELSVAEAAARAGVSRAALKVRAHRGYRALRALLGRRDA